MKAKKVYEFIQKKSLKNTIKDDIGIKYNRKKEIEEWIEENDLSRHYQSYDLETDELRLHGKIAGLRLRKNIDKFPVSRLYVLGDLFLTNTKYLEYLPNYTTITGWLDLENSNILKLPDNLFVGGSLDISDTYNLTVLPTNLEITHMLYMLNSSINNIPDNIKVSDQIIITDNMNIIYSNKLKNKIIIKDANTC